MMRPDRYTRMIPTAASAVRQPNTPERPSCTDHGTHGLVADTPPGGLLPQMAVMSWPAMIAPMISAGPETQEGSLFTTAAPHRGR